MCVLRGVFKVCLCQQVMMFRVMRQCALRRQLAWHYVNDVLTHVCIIHKAATLLARGNQQSMDNLVHFVKKSMLKVHLSYCREN